MQENRDPACSLLLMQRIYSEAWKPHQRQIIGFWGTKTETLKKEEKKKIKTKILSRTVNITHSFVLGRKNDKAVTISS